MAKTRNDLDVVFTERQNGREELVVDRPVYGASDADEAIRTAGWSEGQADGGVICMGVSAKRTAYGHAVRQRFRSVRGNGGFRRSQDGRLESPVRYTGEVRYAAAIR